MFKYQDMNQELIIIEIKNHLLNQLIWLVHKIILQQIIHYLMVNNNNNHHYLELKIIIHNNKVDYLINKQQD
jgi:hypothetical protein